MSILPPSEGASFFSIEQRARLLIAALGIAIAFALASYLPGLIGSVILYVVLVPVHRRISPLLGPRAAAFLLAIAALVLLLLPGGWLLTTAVAQAPDALLRAERSTAFVRLTTLHLGTFDVGARIAAAGGALLSWASRQALSLFGSATRATLNLMIALFGLYYLLPSSDAAWREFKHYLPFSDGTAEALRARFHTITEAMILGIAVTATLQGTIIGVTFAVVGLPNALFWGILTAIVSVLPVLGSALVWLPGTAVLLLDGRYGAGIALGLVGAIVASNIDNVARLVVYRRVSQTHPMVTLVGAFAGVERFGLPGLLLGPLAISYFFELLKFYRLDNYTQGPRGSRVVEPVDEVGTDDSHPLTRAGAPG